MPVHYRGGKRIDTTQANRFPNPESLRHVGHAEHEDVLTEVRKIIREEVHAVLRERAQQRYDAVG